MINYYYSLVQHLQNEMSCRSSLSLHYQMPPELGWLGSLVPRDFVEAKEDNN